MGPRFAEPLTDTVRDVVWREALAHFSKFAHDNAVSKYTFRFVLWGVEQQQQRLDEVSRRAFFFSFTQHARFIKYGRTWSFIISFLFVSQNLFKVESVYNEMDCATPVIYLLSAGADPTDSVEVLARKKKTDVACVSMGEVQIFGACHDSRHTQCGYDRSNCFVQSSSAHLLQRTPPS